MVTIAQYVRRVPKGTLALIAVIAAIVVVVAVVLLAQSPTEEAAPAGVEDTRVPTVAAQASDPRSGRRDGCRQPGHTNRGRTAR